MTTKPTQQQESYIEEFCSHLNRWKRKDSLPVAGMALDEHLMLFTRLRNIPSFNWSRISNIIPKDEGEFNAMFEGEFLFIWKDASSQWDSFDNACEVFACISSEQIRKESDRILSERSAIAL